MNLRDKDDNLSFPPRDKIPSRLLTCFPNNGMVYKVYCYAFFIALFHTVEEYLSTSDGKDGVMRWVRQMCDMSEPPQSAARDDFFRTLARNYGKV